MPGEGKENTGKRTLDLISSLTQQLDLSSAERLEPTEDVKTLLSVLLQLDEEDGEKAELLQHYLAAIKEILVNAGDELDYSEELSSTEHALLLLIAFAQIEHSGQADDTEEFTLHQLLTTVFPKLDIDTDSLAPGQWVERLTALFKEGSLELAPLLSQTERSLEKKGRFV